MRSDEFNHVTINNEKDGFSSFEFGHTQQDESTFFSDNKSNIRDEVNDTPTKNSENNKREEKKRRENKENEDRLRDQLSKSESSESSSSASSGASSGASSAAGASGAAAGASGAIASVAGASVVAVTTISAIVGINVYIQAKVKMNNIEVTPISLTYDLDLTDTNDDKFIITLENKENNYYSYQDLEEGSNVGEFTDLTSETKYAISVIDVTSSNFAIYKDEVTTSKIEPEPEPPTPPEPGPEPTPTTYYTVAFDSLGGTEIPSQRVEAGKTATKPETDPVKDRYEFGYWTLDLEEPSEFDFTTPINSNIVLYAYYIEPQTPGIYSIDWDKGIDYSNYSIVYSLDYDDPEEILGDFKLTVSYVDEESHETIEESFPLPIKSRWGNVPLESASGEDLIDLTFGKELDYAFTYYDGYAGDILVLESGTMVFNDVNGKKEELSSFHFNYFQYDSSTDSTTMSYEYDFTNAYGIYSDIKLLMYIGDPDQPLVNQKLTDMQSTGSSSQKGESGSETFTNVVFGDNLFNYKIIGTHTETGKVRIYQQGSVNPSKLNYEASFDSDTSNIGGPRIDNGVYYTKDLGQSQTRVYVPVKLSYIDYLDNTYGEELTLRYDLSYDGGTLIVDTEKTIEKIQGTQLVSLGNFEDFNGGDLILNAELTYLDEEEETQNLLVVQNRTLSLASTSEVIGGHLDSDQIIIDAQPTVNLFVVTNAEYGSGITSMALYFVPQKATDQGVMSIEYYEYIIDYKGGTDLYSDYISVPLNQNAKYLEMLEYMKTYATDVIMNYKLSGQDEYVTVNLYSQKTFYVS